LTAVVRGAAEAEAHGEHPLAIRAADPIEATFDVVHVTTLVRQLVRNAVAFSPAEAPIEVAVARGDGEATIEVRDRGPGIPPERREQVFGRFADWRPPGYETVPGPGLGLFIARALAHGHGGSISIADAPGGGTMLAARLPLGGVRGTADDDAADL
ncbi:MAG TPA: sensor histidine kinase, partial [Actinomycetota bacterium]|nr:sensor histidine kinase [Actinomycetota bacterium]